MINLSASDSNKVGGSSNIASQPMDDLADGQETFPIEKTSKKSNKVLQVISLFSGGGGLDLGLEVAGFDTMFASDIDRYSCSTLQNGRKLASKRGLDFLSRTTVIRDDIEDLSGQFVLEASQCRKGEVHLLSGGPPCQAFSIFGRRKGREDKRGMLVHEYFRLLAEISPHAFVFENVFGLLTVENGKVFEAVRRYLAEPKKGLKYNLSVIRLNACAYGVPQFRDRIFIIGSRSGKKINSIDELTVEPNSFRLDEQYAYRTVEDAFRGLPSPNLDFPANHTGRKHSDRIIQRYASMKFGQRDNFTRINKLDPSRPSFTIIVGSDKGGGKGHIHPTEPREVTPRESARIQTFPDWWPFVGKVRHPIRQIGNAVPPLLGFAVGNAVREQIFDLNPIPYKQALQKLSQEHLFPELYDQYL